MLLLAQFQKFFIFLIKIKIKTLKVFVWKLSKDWEDAIGSQIVNSKDFTVNKSTGKKFV